MVDGACFYLYGDAPCKQSFVGNVYFIVLLVGSLSSVSEKNIYKTLNELFGLEFVERQMFG